MAYTLAEQPWAASNAWTVEEVVAKALEFLPGLIAGCAALTMESYMAMHDGDQKGYLIASRMCESYMAGVRLAEGGDLEAILAKKSILFWGSGTIAMDVMFGRLTDDARNLT